MYPATMDSLPRLRPKCRGFESIGKPYVCRPHLAPDNLTQCLQWSWFPWDFKFGVLLGMQIAIVALTVVSYFCLVIFRNTVSSVFALLSSILILILGFVSYIIDWNFKLREAMCFASGKRIQAEETWLTYLGENGEKDRAKEVFHTETFKSVAINILKDGTVEFRNRGVEFSASFMGATFGDNAMRQAQSEENLSSSCSSMNSGLAHAKDGYAPGGGVNAGFGRTDLESPGEW